MTITPLQLARVRAVIFAKVAEHSELNRPLTLASIKRVLARESVTFLLRHHPRPAQLIRTATGWKIVVDRRSSDRERIVYIVHELGHHWLGHAGGDFGDPVAFDRSPDWHHAQREDEANALVEILVPGLPYEQRTSVGKSKPVRKPRRQSAASNVPLATRKAPPPLPLPGWLEDVERDADAVRLQETAKAAAREDARRAPNPTDEPTIRFAIPRDQWVTIQLLPLSAAGPYPHYSNVYTAPHHEYVTCTVTAARGIVEQLARAGFKRTAVHVRRILREALAMRGVTRA